jgi:hypothetical protein
MAMRDAGREGITLDYDQAIKQASKIYGIPYQPSELPKLLAQRKEIDRQLALLKQGKQVAKARDKRSGHPHRQVLKNTGRHMPCQQTVSNLQPKPWKP